MNDAVQLSYNDNDGYDDYEECAAALPGMMLMSLWTPREQWPRWEQVWPAVLWRQAS